jgi:DNA-binding transcriptional LysR family regulator
MQINLNQPRTFFLVAKEKNITTAANALHITQPAVIMQMKAFEKNLDAKLLRKYGKELQLTDIVLPRNAEPCLLAREFLLLTEKDS